MKTKKILSVLLVALMALAFSGVTAFAASITVEKPETDGTDATQYTYYQILKASISENGEKVAYYVEDETQATALKGTGVFTVTKVVGGWTVELVEGKTGEDIAAALDGIKDNFTASDPFKAGEKQEVEVEDTVEAWMMFEDGRRGCFYASNGYAADAPVIIDIQGERGRISLTGSELSLYTSGNSPDHFQCDTKKGIGKDYWGCGHKACIMDFYRCLDTGERFQNDLFGVENTFNTMMKIYEESRGMADEITYIRVGDMVII